MKALGDLLFYLDTTDQGYKLMCETTTREEYIQSVSGALPEIINEYRMRWDNAHTIDNDDDIIDGMEFVESVECSGFTNYDGYIEMVIVDGYFSNIGIHSNSLTSGDFRLSLESFKKLCEQHDVKVVWINK